MTFGHLEKERPVPQHTDTAMLVEAAGKGDCESFTELCRQYYPAMVAIAHSTLGDEHLAEDAAQQAFAKAALKLPQLRKKNQFANWLAAICRNCAKDMAQAVKRHDTTKDLSMIAAISQEDAGVEAIREAIADLSASDKEVIYLRFYDGMTYERISEVLGITEQAINGRLRRAKKKIAGYLRHNGFDEVNV